METTSKAKYVNPKAHSLHCTKAITPCCKSLGYRISEDSAPHQLLLSSMCTLHTYQLMPSGHSILL